MKKEESRAIYLAVLSVFGMIAAFIAGVVFGWTSGKDGSPGVVEETRKTTVDTIVHRKPTAWQERIVGKDRYILPVYRFIGGGAGGDPRQRSASDSTEDSCPTLSHSGTGAGGGPRQGADSAVVELEIVQRHYKDSTYEAWVSGPVDPRLDSVTVFARSTVITKQVWKPPKRWHVGVTAGYGYGPRGFQPFVGVGVTYSILSF
ncbi:MAG: hypothetical protein J6K19_03860 [Prevotella sp.]|nr:hypothetical protein [Prevotella sp.]